jgi:alkaline phosphatase D
LVPSFPSKTFPNHYTIATGLYPNKHGLVNNSFYDRTLDKSYAIGNKEARFNSDFYKGEPIWVTAQKQGVLTASYFWVGSDVPIQELQPNFWKQYDGSVALAERIDTIIKWLSLPYEERPRLIMAYYHEPDEIGHQFGPDDPRILGLVQQLDSLTGILYNHIRHLPNGDSINFILLSDHGMGNVIVGQNIVLMDYIPGDWPVRIEGGNPNFNIYTEKSYIDSVYSMLKNVNGMKVWKPSEVPVHLNYGLNPRVGDIIVVADSGWSVTRSKQEKDYSKGTHGYDILNTDMHAIFYASGPDFRKDYLKSSFQNIHIYALLAYLLRIEPTATDGNINAVKDMLVN